MKRDFFMFTSPRIDELNQTERNIFDYVVKNIHEVKDKSIRTLAHECYVSTTTIFRFVIKLGFDGYGDFINTLRLTDFVVSTPEIPKDISQKNYTDSYLCNIAESLRVIPNEKVKMLYDRLEQCANIYFLSEGLNREVVNYARHLFTVLGFNVLVPHEPYEIRYAIQKITEKDILWVFSLSGQNLCVIDTLERIISKNKPFIVSITAPNNNTIQSLSDLNFYVFTNTIQFSGSNITSRIPMLAIVEILVYSWIVKNSGDSIS